MKSKTKAKITPKTVSEYVAKLPHEQRVALEKLRKAIKNAVPAGEECIRYQIPAVRLDTKFLVGFAAWRKHCAFYPGSYPLKVHKELINAYDIDKGTIRFLPANPLPTALVRKLVRTRIAELAG